MKKNILGAAIVAALSSVEAQAVTVPTIDSTKTTTVYVSGASAQKTFIENLIVSPSVSTSAGYLPAASRICDPAQPIWKFSDNTGGSNQNAYYCTKSSANPALSSAQANLLIYKRSDGGSDMGVAPVIANSAVGFLNIASSNCTASTAAVGGTTTTNPVIGQVSCNYVAGSSTYTNVTNHTVDLGVSDVDPAQFVGLNVSAGYTDVTADGVAKLTVTSTAEVVFGEPVTLNLYKALQAAQQHTGLISTTCSIGDRTNEACMPSLTSSQIASFHSADFSDWNSLVVDYDAAGNPIGLYDWTVANNPSFAPAANSIHICRRVHGSGTQTQHGINFMDYPCSDSANAIAPADDAYGLDETAGGLATANPYAEVIHEMTAAGDVNDCLNSLDTATQKANSNFVNKWAIGSTSGQPNLGVRWAIGLQSLESNGSNFEFVKVDGVAPTLAHVVDGTYKDWVENTYQYNTAAHNASAADVQAVVNFIIGNASNPTILASLNTSKTHLFGNGAYVATPVLFTPTTTSYNASNPVGVYSHATLNAPVNNCRRPTAYNGSAYVK